MTSTVDNKQYCSRKLVRKVSFIMEDNGNGKEGSLASTKELYALVRAIQTEDHDLLTSQLNESSGDNISDRMVTVGLPKKWHHVARTAISTPLRTAVTWRNVKALDAILTSKCVITHSDICSALQKILRHIETDVDLEIIRRLVGHRGTVDTPGHFTHTFEKLFLSGQLDNMSLRVVNVICTSGPSNDVLGKLLLAVARRSSKNRSSPDNNVNSARFLDERWPEFRSQATKVVLQSAFDPTRFLTDTRVWLSFGRVAFLNLIHALPVMVQTMTSCPAESLGWVLRHVSRYYGHTGTDGRRLVRRLPRLMSAAGMDMRRVMSVACLSPRFMHDTGFDQYTQRQGTELRSLHEHCRAVIRRHISVGNVYYAMTHMTCIPVSIRDYILLREVEPLPWDD